MRSKLRGLMSSQGRVVLVSGAMALLVLGVAAYVGRGWLWERWCLFRLSQGLDDDSWPLVVELYERKCVAVTPHLLAWYRSHPIDRVKGTIGMQSETQHWGQRVWTLVRLGPAVVPYLAGRLEFETGDSWEALYLLDVLQDLGPEGESASQAVLAHARRSLHQEDPWIREALDALQAMGERALHAVHNLSRSCLKHARERGKASLVYDVLGYPKIRARELLLPLLDDLLGLDAWLPKDEDTYWVLLLTLGSLGPEAQKAVPALEKAFQSDSCRPFAALALAGVVPGHARALEYLEERLSDPAAEDWLTLVQRLRFVRGGAPKLLPHLARGLEVENVSEPKLIIWAMFEIDADFAVKRLMELLDDTRPARRILAIESLVDLEQVRPEVVRKLLLLGDDDDEEVAWAALTALATAGQVEPEALAVYSWRLRHGAPDEADGGAGKALGLLARSQPRVQEIISSALSPNWTCASVALDAVTWMGSARDELAPRVEALLSSGDADLAEAARKTLAELRGDWQSQYRPPALPAR